MNKINRNAERDAENMKKLTDMGWKVVTVWECDLKMEKKENTLNGLVLEIEQQESFMGNQK